MATDPINPGNAVRIARNIIAEDVGATTVIFALDPNKFTSIHVVKGVDTAVVSVTNDMRNVGNLVEVTDLEGSGILWNERSTGADDYFAGDSAGITGVRIVSTPTENDIEYSIIQYMKR